MFFVPKRNRHRQCIFILSLYLQFKLPIELKRFKKCDISTINSKIFERLDLSNEFWSQFNFCDTSTKKPVGLIEIESSDNPNIVTIAVNSKEYFKKYRNKSFNK